LRLDIVTIGRLKPAAPERLLYDDYVLRFARLGERLGMGPLGLREVAPRGDAPGSELKALTAAIPARAARIALDPTGMPITSEDFAALLTRFRDEGTPGLAFLIGGAEGLGPLRETAAARIAFGPATWPHLLVRVMLAEQLYRAATILLGHPYHRGGSASHGQR
jgi:23S rRNA (pseudouridine1915-N3)-methyltransferase